MPHFAQATSLFDVSDDPAIRTPKRPGGFAAQVWTERGHWEHGVHPTKREARSAAHVLAALLPDAPPAPAVFHKRRCRGHTSHYKWVRFVKGHAAQARCWLEGRKCAVNLGLFTVDEYGSQRESCAALVSKGFVKLWTADRTIAEAVELLKKEPRKPGKSWPCPAGLVVPEHLADLKPSRDFGATEDADERRERLRRARIERAERAYPVDLFGQPVAERLAEMLAA